MREPSQLGWCIKGKYHPKGDGNEKARFNKKRILLISLVLIVAVVGFVVPAFAGGWATIEVDSLAAGSVTVTPLVLGGVLIGLVIVGFIWWRGWKTAVVA